ncbi:molybdopterin guanine dinucleotide synthesis protein b, partial [Cystoisospora suis]
MRQGGPGTLSLFCDVCGPRCLRLRCRELQHVELHHGFLLPDDHQHERALRKNEVHPASQDTKTSLSQEAKRPRQPGDSLRGTREEDYSEGDGDKEEQSDVIHRRVGEVREESSSESSDGGIEAFDADLGYSGEVSSVRTDAPILPSVSGGDVREEEEEEEPKEAPEEEQKEEEESSGDGESSVGTRDDGDTNNNREGLRLEKKSTFLWQEEERGLRGARLVRTWDASVEKALSLSSLCRNNCLLDFQTKHTWIRRREHHDGGPGGHHLLRGGVERDEGSQGEEIQARGDSEEETKWEIEQQRRKMTEHLLVLTESLRGDLWGTAIPSPYYDVVSCQEYGHVRKTSNLASDQKSLPRQEEDTQLNDHIHSSFQQQGKGPNDSMVSSSDEEVLSEENDKKPPLCLAVQKELNSDEASCQDPLSLPDGGSGPSDLKENRSDHGSRRPSLSSPLQHNDTAHLSSSRSPLLSSSSSSISLPQCEGTEPSGISKPFIAEPDKQRRVSPIPSDQPHKPLSSDAPASLLSKDEKEAVVSPSCSRIECDDLRSNPSSKRFFQKEESSLPDSCVMDQTGKGKKRGKREKATLVSRDGFEVYVLPMAAGEWIRIDSSIWFKVLRGAVEVRGHIFPPSSSYRLISSPPWSPTIRLMALKRFCNASEQRNDYVSQSSSLESLPGCFGEAESSAHLPEVSPGDRGHSHGGLASRTESRVQGSLQVEMKNGCMQRPWKEKLHFEGEKQFDNCTTKGPANECICIPETQFVEFTGGDPETTEAAFLASLQ